MRRMTQGQQSRSGLTDGSQNAKVRALQVPRDEGRGLLLGDSPKSSPHTKAPSCKSGASDYVCRITERVCGHF